MVRKKKVKKKKKRKEKEDIFFKNEGKILDLT